MTIKLEYGKRYVTRDGRVCGPLVATPADSRWHPDFPFFAEELPPGDWCWREDGTWSVLHPHEHGKDLVAEYTEPEQADAKPPESVRQFESGATRNLDHNKLDYEGFNCPASERAFAKYMHTHRKQADGAMRDSDNWQKGIPVNQYMKSIRRHVQDLHLLHRGWAVVRPEDGAELTPSPESKIELLCAVWFNVQGMIHELLKAERSAVKEPFVEKKS
jgi:hypothetical protein